MVKTTEGKRSKWYDQSMYWLVESRAAMTELFWLLAGAFGIVVLGIVLVTLAELASDIRGIEFVRRPGDG